MIKNYVLSPVVEYGLIELQLWVDSFHISVFRKVFVATQWQEIRILVFLSWMTLMMQTLLIVSWTHFLQLDIRYRMVKIRLRLFLIIPFSSLISGDFGAYSHW